MPVQKKIALFSIGRCQTDGITQSAVFFTANGGLFERPTAAFFTMAFCVYIISLLNPNQPNDRFVFNRYCSMEKAKLKVSLTLIKKYTIR